MAATVCAAACAQCCLVWMGLGGWRCPFYELTGLPCPGCGLTRASVALLRGDLRGALAIHFFAPAVLVALALLSAALVLPTGARLRLAGKVEAVERHTALTGVAALGMICYWLARLSFERGALIGLIKG